MSPSDLGEFLKPFVFLDRIDGENLSRIEGEGLGLHPHSGIATLTWLFEGSANYEDNLGRRGEPEPGMDGVDARWRRCLERRRFR